MRHGRGSARIKRLMDSRVALLLPHDPEGDPSSYMVAALSADAKAGGGRLVPRRVTGR